MPNEARGGPSGTEPTPDGGYVFTISVHTGRENPFHWPRYAVKVDNNLDVKWQTRIPDNGDWYILAAGLALPDTSVLFGGWVYPWQSDNDYGILLKVLGDGTIAWQRKYSGPEHLGKPRISNLYYDSISSFVYAVGTTLTGLSDNSDPWLARIDNIGCIIPGCDTLDGGTGMPLPVRLTDFAVYPNPTAGPLVLDVPPDKMKGPLELQVYASTGQLVWQEKLPEGRMRHRFDFSDLPAGLYLAVLQSGGQIAGQSRFVKQ